MITNIFFLLSFLTISHGRNLNNYNPGSRIVNGKDAEQGELPFQVSLQTIYGHFCGGSILNEDYVVTAAHCVVGHSVAFVKVIAGTVDLLRPHSSHKVEKITINTKYNPLDSYRDDIALLKVETPFVFSELIQPVELPNLHAKVKTNATAVVSGWGRLGANSVGLPTILQKAQIWIADQDYCQTVMRKQSMTIYPTHICANDPNTRRGQCNGDSGGPLTVDGILTGIVSWSIKDPYCASIEYPGVFTRVSEYVDWILEHAV